MAWLIFALISVFSFLAFGQTIPDPGVDVGGWALTVFHFITSKEWGMVVAGGLVGLTFVLRKLATLDWKLLAWAKGKYGGWALNVLVSALTYLSAALLAHQAVTIALIGQILVQIAANAGTWEVFKDGSFPLKK